MITKVRLGILFLFVSNFLQAQIVTVASGTDLVVKTGTPFFADNIVFTPSADFTLTNISLSRNTTITNAANHVNIARVYKFSGNTNAFSGNIQINYQDGAELNGLAENSLELNIHDGTMWKVFNPAANDVTNNYVLTTSLSGIAFNELTLAAAGSALPLQWRSFIAAKQQKNVQLQWSTFSEQNSKNFTVQNSVDGITWVSLSTVAAAGSSSSVSIYNYLHISPAAGYNYYRIVETGLDGKKNYSVVQKIFFESSLLHVELLGNPVTNGMLQVKVNPATSTDIPPMLKLYTSDGKLLRKIQSTPGINTIKVNSFAKGAYLLQANNTTIKFLIK